MAEPTSPPYRGSCLCGRIAYAVSAQIRNVSHCHCTMCRKTHGAAFGSHGSVPGAAHAFTQGQELLGAYRSSAGVTRTFCSACGSPLLWHDAQGTHPDWVSIPLATLDTPFMPTKQKHVHSASKVPWYAIADGWPQT